MYVYIYIYIHMCMSIYIYIYICTHTYTGPHDLHQDPADRGAQSRRGGYVFPRVAMIRTRRRGRGRPPQQRTRVCVVTIAII